MTNAKKVTILTAATLLLIISCLIAFLVFLKVRKDKKLSDKEKLKQKKVLKKYKAPAKKPSPTITTDLDKETIQRPQEKAIQEIPESLKVEEQKTKMPVEPESQQTRTEPDDKKLPKAPESHILHPDTITTKEHEYVEPEKDTRDKVEKEAVEPTEDKETDEPEEMEDISVEYEELYPECLLPPNSLEMDGRTCTVNAVIQLLLSSTGFVHYFESHTFDKATQPCSTIFKDYIEDHRSGKKAITTEPLFSFLRVKTPRAFEISGWSDAVRLYRSIYVCLESELGREELSFMIMYETSYIEFLECKSVLHDDPVPKSCKEIIEDLENGIENTLVDFFTEDKYIGVYNPKPYNIYCADCEKDQQAILHQKETVSDTFIAYNKLCQPRFKFPKTTLFRELNYKDRKWKLRAFLEYHDSKSTRARLPCHYTTVGYRKGGWYNFDESKSIPTIVPERCRGVYLLMYERVKKKETQ